MSKSMLEKTVIVLLVLVTLIGVWTYEKGMGR